MGLDSGIVLCPESCLMRCPLLCRVCIRVMVALSFFLNCAVFYNRYWFLMRKISIRSLPHSASFADYKGSIKYVKSMLINAIKRRCSLSINRCISDPLRVICICYTFHSVWWSLKLSNLCQTGLFVVYKNARKTDASVRIKNFLQWR